MRAVDQYCMPELYIYIYNEFPNLRARNTQGLRGNVTDACERHDPCQHGGICISTDSGPLCECRNLEYEGTYCERGKCPHFVANDALLRIYTN